MEGKMTSLAALKKMAQEAIDMGHPSRDRSLTCVQYYHKKGLTQAERNELRARGQPDIQINRIRPALNGTLGVLQQGRTDPQAWPRTPDDEQSADVATKTLRYIADYNEFDSLRIEAARDYMLQHACAAMVRADDDNRVKIDEIAPQEFLFDPRALKEDFKDARYLGIAKWLYADDVSGMYADKKEGIDAAIDSGSPFPVDQSLEDRPNGLAAPWVDRKRRRLLVVELYYRELGKWNYAIFHTGGILEQGPSRYQDEKKRPCCPIVAQSCYVDDENVRYGIVFDWLDLQDEITKRRSKALHFIMARQSRVGPAGPDPAEVREELAKPDGVIVAEPDDFEVLDHEDMAQGNLAMLQEAKNEMERAGPNPAVLGRTGENSSGRNNLIRNQAGLTELAVVLAGHEAWERRVYRQAWNVARQYWTAPDYIRVTDDQGAPQFIGINQPQMGPPQVVMGPNGMPTIQPTILGYQHALAEMDIDITLDTVPDTATLQQEEFQVLSELAKLYGPQEVPFDDMLMLSSIPDKQKLLERRKARQQEAQQGQQPQQMLAMQAAQDEHDLTQSEIAKNLAQAHSTQAKIGIDAFKAGAAG